MDSEGGKNLLKQNLAPLALGILGLLLIGIGLFQVLSKKQSQSSLTFQEAEKKEVEEQIAVDIEGAVIKPGVYSLRPGARIVDALAVAGGLSEEADREWLEKNINLAKKVSDGLKIYIPRIGEEVLSESLGQVESGSPGPVLNINTASSSDLESLSGIGPVTANKIIEGRPYAQIEELLSKKIVGNATFEKIKDKISAD